MHLFKERQIRYLRQNSSITRKVYLKNIRQGVVQSLWHKNLYYYPNLNKVIPSPTTLDHFAVIDTGNYQNGFILQPLFEKLGYVKVGEGYLEGKQNHFIWMRVQGMENCALSNYEPQVVLANFNYAKLPSEVIQNIKTPTSKYKKISEIIDLIENIAPYEKVVNSLLQLFTQPKTHHLSLSEYMEIHQHNQLLAWATLHPLEINHFGINLSFSNEYQSLAEFNKTVESKTNYKLNYEGGKIKGCKKQGIEQSSVQSIQTKINGITITTPFIEFVWRYGNNNNKVGDYFLDFIPTNANKVVESIF